MSRLPFEMAHPKGVQPEPFSRLTSAPKSFNALTILRFSVDIAKVNRVHPLLSIRLRSAPCSAAHFSRFQFFAKSEKN